MIVWYMGGKYGQGCSCATHVTEVFVNEQCDDVIEWVELEQKA